MARKRKEPGEQEGGEIHRNIPFSFQTPMLKTWRGAGRTSSGGENVLLICAIRRTGTPKSSYVFTTLHLVDHVHIFFGEK